MPPGFLKSARRLLQAAAKATREGALETNTYHRYSERCNKREVAIIESIVTEMRSDIHKTLYLGNAALAQVEGADTVAHYKQAREQLIALLKLWYPDHSDDQISRMAAQKQDYEASTGIRIGSQEFQAAEQYALEMLKGMDTKNNVGT